MTAGRSETSLGVLGHAQIELVQALDLFLELFERAAVVDEVVGRGHALVARNLRVDDRAGLFFAEMTVVDEAVDLLVFGDVDDENALAGVGPAAVLKQQGNRENHIRRLDGLELLEHLALDHRVQDRFEQLELFRIGKDDLAHQITLHAVGVDHVGAEGNGDFRQRRPLGAGEPAADLVGVDDRYAELAENVGDCCFAAGNAACQTDDHGHISPLSSSCSMRPAGRRARRASASIVAACGRGGCRDLCEQTVEKNPVDDNKEVVKQQQRDRGNL